MQQLAEGVSNDSGTVTNPKALVVIGASTGGPTALAQILPKLPRSLDAAIVVVQQMRPGFTGLLARQLNTVSELDVQESGNFHALGIGSVLFAPGDCGISIDRPGAASGRPCIVRVESVVESADRMRSRIDEAMASAAEQFGKRAIGILLSGVGDDGRRGMTAIRSQGGRTLAQDESSSIVFDMPRNAIDAGVVDEIVPVWSIADLIVEIVGDF